MDDRTLEAIERETQIAGRQIFARLRIEPPSILQREWWDERILERCMQDEALKIQMFRFIDVLPTLRTPEQIVRHLQEYFLGDERLLPTVAQWGLQLAGPGSPAARPIAQVVRHGATRMAERFLAGATLEQALAVIERLRQRQLGFSLDILGEAAVSEPEAEAYQRQYLDLLEGLAPHARAWTPAPLIDDGPAGPLPRVNVSVKLTSLYSQFDPIDPPRSITAVAERLRPILRAAMRTESSVTVDMEQYEVKDLTLQAFREVVQEPEFRAYPHFGIAVQAYLRECEEDVRALGEWARQRGTPIHVRLVKGAYWDYETTVARQREWPVPVFTAKWETDASFARVVLRLLEHADHLRPAVGSHNVRSLAFALAASRQFGLPERLLEFQLLYGMGDPIKEALVQLGQRVRVYTPIGELIPGMGYLVRRLLENTSNDSFLRQTFTEHRSDEALLRKPGPEPIPAAPALPHEPPSPAIRPGAPHPAPGAAAPVAAVPPFRNEPELDFAKAEARAALQEALGRVRRRLGRLYPVVIAGDEVTTAGEITSVNPSRPDELIGRVGRAGPGEADQAVSAARAAQPEWAARPPQERAEVLFRAAELMRGRRAELAAWEVLEAGKPWREADADVAEAIDYLEYYGREMLRLGSSRLLDEAPGEVNEYLYRPRGVAVVIAPWNFPLAILSGMASAALVTGNAV
ncbi:MAG: bifunctional proline dehydrogenase/L-glutamate gamma-semialdehyde dehydrogenase, partial [Deltaproteobacteria bacterium]|nr:bifunctional proline dehydrogenase/L-glutamate gamma-semialdehyde dehydrogenase [Deltaproteobacteria bacterium]